MPTPQLAVLLAAGSVLALPLAPPRLAGQRITVGNTVHVSADAPSDPHGESFLAIDPRNSRNLIAATNVARKSGAGTSAYASHDGGQSWTRVTLPPAAAKIGDAWDVVAYFDAGSNAYYGG